jgi:sugar phosphate isomerase/epimerase
VSNLIGFHSIGLHKYPVETVIEKVAAAGYYAVELNAETVPWAQPHVTPSLSAEGRKRLGIKAEDAGLVVSAIGAHVNMVVPDSETRQANLDYALGCVELASDVGIEVVHLFSGTSSAGVSRSEMLDWLVEGTSRCIERGRILGVKIAFEAVATHLICDVISLRELVEAVRPLELGVNFDPSHFHVHGDDAAAAVRDFGDRISYVHVKDASGTPGDYRFPPLGQGDVDFPGFMSALKETGYGGVLSVEYEADVFGYRDSEEEILEGSLGFVRRLLA